MDIVEMPFEILLVLDRVLPESPVPDVALSVLPSRRADAGGFGSRAAERASEENLHPADAPRKPGVSPREAPQEMDVVRQDDRRRDAERSLPHHLLQGEA
jgi:hypothetical protein